LFVLFLTKYNYAAFALAAIGLVDFLIKLQNAKRSAEGNSSDVKITFLNSFAIYFPVLLGVVFWFFTGTDIASTETKWRDFRFFVTNEDSGYVFWSAQNLLFYVRVMLDWLMLHPIVPIAVLLSAGFAVVRVKHVGVLLLLIFFVIGFVLATVHPLKAPRYITPIFPSLWLLSGMGVAYMVKRFASVVARQSIFAVSFLVAAGLWLGVSPNLKPWFAGGIASDLRAATKQIVNWQQPDKPLIIIGTFGEMSPPLIEWRLRPTQNFDIIQYDAPPVEGENDIARVQKWLNKNPGAQVTTIRVGKDSQLYLASDMQNKNLWKQNIVERFDEIKGLRLVERIEYSDSKLSISYYLPE
jgi:hypothetical protein